MNALEEIVFPAVDDLLAAEPRPGFAREAGTRLVGEGAALDSLGLVTFLVGVEARLADATGLEVVLASEKALSRKHSPFRTLGTLAEYVEELLAEAGAGR